MLNDFNHLKAGETFNVIHSESLCCTVKNTSFFIDRFLLEMPEKYINKGHFNYSNISAWWVEFYNCKVIECKTQVGPVRLGQRWSYSKVPYEKDFIFEVIELPKSNKVNDLYQINCRIVQVLKSNQYKLNQTDILSFNDPCYMYLEGQDVSKSERL
jgi:hypothetical protein